MSDNQQQSGALSSNEQVPPDWDGCIEALKTTPAGMGFTCTARTAWAIADKISGTAAQQSEIERLRRELERVKRIARTAGVAFDPEPASAHETSDDRPGELYRYIKDMMRSDCEPGTWKVLAKFRRFYPEEPATGPSEVAGGCGSDGSGDQSAGSAVKATDPHSSKPAEGG